MGGLYSMHSSWKSEESTGATPTYPMKHKRLFSLDPRSPSQGIDRTPILVDRTPSTASGRLGSCDAVSATPHAASSLIKDPRSPTNEFLRTPIPCALAAAVRQRGARGAAQAYQGLDESLSPSQHAESESGIDSTEVTPVLGREVNAAVDSPDMLDSSDSAVSDGYTESHQSEHMSDLDLSDGGLDIDSLEPGIADMSPPVIDHVDNSVTEAETESEEVMDVDNESLTSIKPVPATDIDITPKLRTTGKGPAKMNKKSGQLSWSPAVTRSPLSLVENSRRALNNRQDKQMPASKSDKLMSARVIDKENIFH